MKKKVSLQLKITAATTAILVVMFVILTLFNAYSLDKISREFSSRILEDASLYEATDVEKFIRNIIDYTDGAGSAIKGIMARGNFDRAYLESIIVDTCLNLPDQVIGAGVALGEGIYKNNKLSVYVTRQKDGEMHIDTLVGEEDFELEFYTVPVKTKEYNITDLYKYKVHDKDILMFTYSIPLFVGKEIVGVFFADVIVSPVQEMIKSFKPFDKATSFIMDSKGNIVAISEESKESYIGKSVYELYPFYKEEKIFDKLKGQHTYAYKRKDPATKIMNANVFSEIDVWAIKNGI